MYMYNGYMYMYMYMYNGYMYMYMYYNGYMYMYMAVLYIHYYSKVWFCANYRTSGEFQNNM